MLNSKHENLANSTYYAKSIRPAEIHGWLLKCVVKVQ